MYAIIMLNDDSRVGENLEESQAKMHNCFMIITRHLYNYYKAMTADEG